jgi:hypothetical protein
MGRDAAVDRLGVPGCCGCEAQNGDVRAAESGCRARTAARVFPSLRCGRLAKRWEVPELVGGRPPLGVVGCMSRLLRTAEGQCTPRRSAAVLWRERQPPAVGVTRSLMDGSVSSAGWLSLVSVAAPRWACCGVESGVRPVARCAWGARRRGGPIVLTAARIPARVEVTVASATLADAIAFEARGREGVGLRVCRSRCAVWPRARSVAASACSGLGERVPGLCW